MTKANLVRVFIQSALVVILPLALGCSQKAVKSDESTAPAIDAARSSNLGDGALSSDQGNAKGLQTVHFGYESSTLSADAKKVLKENAEVMSRNPSLRIQIEGHCDQRGGIQYNIALGEKRANSAKHYMEDLGVAAGRITTISYGKERVLDSAENETAYAKNRRANFVITKIMG